MNTSRIFLHYLVELNETFAILISRTTKLDINSVSESRVFQNTPDASLVQIHFIVMADQIGFGLWQSSYDPALAGCSRYASLLTLLNAGAVTHQKQIKRDRRSDTETP